ncbi:MAG: hypothetical protein ACREGF_04295, partial [Candidatus Saccharimonadales bacterium]
MPKQTPVKPVLFVRTLSLLALGLFSALLLLGLTAFNPWFNLHQPATALAATTNNGTINFQARLMSAGGSIVPDGNYNIEFKLYNTTSSSGSPQGSCSGDASCLWTETRSGANAVSVSDGYLTVDLASVTPFPTTINWNQDLYLTMNIGGSNPASPVWDGEMNPRIHLTAVPYALSAEQLAFSNASGSSVLAFATPTQNNAITIPNASGSICLTSGNCVGSGGASSAIGGSGTTNTLALFTSAGTIGNSLLTQSGTTVTVGGNLATTGNLSAAGNISGTGTINISGTGSSSIMGSLGLGVTNPTGALTIANSAWLNSVNAAGSGYINILSVNATNQIQLGAALNIDGGINLPTDVGQVTFSNLPIDTSAAAGTPESYT